MDVNRVRARIGELRGEFEDRLAALVEVPTVSMDPGRHGEMDRCAFVAADYLRAIGARVDIIDTGGFPMVVGRVQRDPSFPTVTIYNHLDVQPADATEWRTPPFTFTRDGDRWIARGSTDDKGPALTALYGARLALEEDARVNIQFLWELEEEIGSPNFEAGLAAAIAGDADRAAFTTDSVVVSDTIWTAAGQPAIPYGLRGLMGFTVALQTGAKDVHSGTTGGAARNPIGELCALIDRCYDAKTGRVKIPGFYDDVVKPTKQELADMKNCGFTTREFKKDHLLKSLRVDDPLEVMKRIWMMPTFEVHGIAGGYQGPGVKTIIPPSATAIVSCRLVPNMKPKKIAKLVKDFVKSKNPDVEVWAEHALPGYSAKTTGPHADAIKASMKFAFGKEPVFVREGGSIGAVLSMEQVLKAPIYFLGLSLPEHGYHAPNENYDWQQGRGGMMAFAEYFRRVGEIS
jgi:acetylornithine deacetylase/succinyl-diaminopimelate desuccinylase-like protein